MRIKLLHGLFQTVKNKVIIFFITLIKNFIFGNIKTQSTIFFTVKNKRERNIKRD